MATFSNFNIIDLAPDDLVFWVQCDFSTLIEFFQKPTDWMHVLHEEAKSAGQLPDGFTGELHIAQDYSIQVRPATIEAARKVESLVKPYEGLTHAERQTLAGGAWTILLENAKEATFTVYGISGTGYVTLDAKPETIAALLITQDWDRYWTAWQNEIKRAGALVLFTESRSAYSHTEITEDNDSERGEKLAIYMLCASRSAYHLNQLLSTEPATCQLDGRPIAKPWPKFVQAIPTVISAMSFSFIENAQASVRACEVKSGAYVPPEGVIVPASLAAKIYSA